MTKTVFSNSMVAHVWAQQTQEYGKSHNGNFYFSGRTIYSYGRHAPLATFTDATDSDGKRVVLLSNEGHSMTTKSKHWPAVWRALRGLNVRNFTVDYVGDSFAQYHDRNIAGMLAALKERAAQLARPMRREYLGYDAADNRIEDTPDNRCNALWPLGDEIAAYCRAFRLDAPSVDGRPLARHIESLQVNIRAAFDRFNDPKRIAAREKRAAQSEKRCASAMARYYAWCEGILPNPPAIVPGMPNSVRRDIKYRRFDLRSDHYAAKRYDLLTVEQWLSGIGNASTRLRDHDSYRATLVRRKGNMLETSRGVDVPWEQAVAAFLFAARCRRKAEAWQRNGQQFRVGQFQLDSVDVDGNIRAGCHTLQWPEMLRLAVKEIPDMVRPTYPVPAIVA